ncbi:hypothetical protein [Streptomyces naphthomycinicus]|uniref:hypothetical protein n=1 Tax=Streptomyces naphthomycinicus TaxID=2872625 RepID=UPI001CEC82C0|nr:hypothetical protein [Streptomyces sp. TML10]
MPMHTRTRTLRFTAVLTLVTLALTGFSSGRHHGHRSGSGSGGGCSSSHQDHDSSTSTSGGGSYGSSGGGSYGSSGGSSYGSDDDHGGSTYRRTHRPTPTPSGSGSRTPLKDGTAKLTGCATAARPYATVEVTNPNDRRAAFTVEVLFLPDSPPAIDSDREEVSVPARGTKTVRVPFTQRSHLDLLDHCQVDERAPLAD